MNLGVETLQCNVSTMVLKLRKIIFIPEFSNANYFIYKSALNEHPTVMNVVQIHEDCCKMSEPTDINLHQDYHKDEHLCGSS
jgi:hypothetical protein